MNIGAAGADGNDQQYTKPAPNWRSLPVRHEKHLRQCANTPHVKGLLLWPSVKFDYPRGAKGGESASVCNHGTSVLISSISKTVSSLLQSCVVSLKWQSNVTNLEECSVWWSC